MSETPYQRLSRAELEQRLERAEAVCLMFGWSPARHDTARDKACHELWVQWLALVPKRFTDPDAHPELDDEVVTQLARKRDDTRTKLLHRTVRPA